MAQSAIDKAFDKLDKNPIDDAFDRLDGKGSQRAQVDEDAFAPRDVSTAEFLSVERPTQRDDLTKLDRALQATSNFTKAAVAAGLSTKVGKLGINTLQVVGDLLSRVNFAVAGAHDEMLEALSPGERALIRDAIDDPSLRRILTASTVIDGPVNNPGVMLNVLKRAGSEIFSGIGSIEGQKKDYGTVLEELGVKEGGRLSSVLPILYADEEDSPTKRFFLLNKGGLFDPSRRGAIGFAGDVLLDPTTYLTLGTGAAVKTSVTTATKTGVRAFSRLGARELGEAFREELLERGLREGADRSRVKLFDMEDGVAVKREPIRGLKTSPVGGDEIPDSIIRTAPDARLVKEGGKGAEPIFRYGDAELTASQLRQRFADDLGIDPTDAIVPLRGMKEGQTVRQYLLRGEIDKLDAPGLFTRLEDSALQAAEERIARRILDGELKLVERGGLKFAGKPVAFQKVVDVTDGRVKLYGRTRQFVRKLEDTLFEPVLHAGRWGRDAVERAYQARIRPTLELFQRDISDNPFFRAMKQDVYNRWDNWLGQMFTRAKRTIVPAWNEFASQKGRRALLSDNAWREVHAAIRNPDARLKGPEGAIARETRRELELIQQAEQQMFPRGFHRPVDELDLFHRPADELAQRQAEGVRLATRSEAEFVVPMYFREYRHQVVDTMQAIYDDLGSNAPVSLVVTGPFGRVNSILSMDEIVRRSARLAKTNPKVKKLTPVLEPTEILTKRAKGFHARASKDDFLRRAQRDFTADDVPAEQFESYQRVRSYVEDFQLDAGHPARELLERMTDADLSIGILSLALTGPVSPRSFRSTVTLPSGARVKKLDFRKSKAVRQAFISRVFLTKVKSLDDFSEFLEYFGRHLEDFPGIQDLSGFRDEFGQKYVRRNYGGGTRWFPDDMARDIDGMDRKFLTHPQLQSLLSRYDGFNRFVKTYLTAPFPSFHFRNAYGNAAQAFTDIGVALFHPGTAKMVRNVLGPEGGKLVDRDAVLKTVTGREYTARQIAQLVRQNKVLTDEQALFEFSGVAEQAARMGAPIRGIGSTERSLLKDVASAGARPLARKGRQAAQTIENSSRVQLFVTYLRRGMRPEDASARVNKFLFDYSNLSNFEQAWMKRLFTFFTFPRKNVPLQIENVFLRPGTTSVQLDLLRSRQEDRDDLAVLRFEEGLVKLGRDEKTVTILDGVDLPVAQLNFLDPLISSATTVAEGAVALTGKKVDLNPIGADQTAKRNAELFGMIQPLFKSLPEIALGRNAFGRRDIDRQQMSVVGQILHRRAPQALQDWLGLRSERDRNGRLVWEMDQSKYKLMVEMWGLSRLISTPDKAWRAWVDSVAEMQDEGKEAEGVEAFTMFLGKLAMDLGTGIRVEELNLTDEQIFRLNLRIKDINELLSRTRGAGGEATIPFIKKEFKKKPRTIDQAFEEAFGE